jgi:hypothetical protein
VVQHERQEDTGADQKLDSEGSMLRLKKIWPIFICAKILAFFTQNTDSYTHTVIVTLFFK